MDNTGYRSLLTYIKQEIRIDGSLYKEKPFKRRIKLRMRYTETGSYSEYLYYLRKNTEEIKLLKDALTINVTRFFRNRSTFEYLERLIKERFMLKQKYVSIFSVGCSS
ncbi:protein-glutamate O-methyltransferase CheR, partial [candidate division WOR-3 bacterium]|nr:protein-glutamate O-methyltransferase CheR [candidate division WOR-3 bacterium]